MYLIYGSDYELVNREINNIITNNCSCDIIKHDLTEIKLSDVIYDASSTSLWQEKKIIICYNPLFLVKELSKDINQIEEFASFVKNRSDENIIIFVLNSDLVDSKSKILKAIKEKGSVIKTSNPKKNDLNNMVADIFKGKNIKINYKAIDYLIARVGEDYSILVREIEKMLLYKEFVSIKESDIDLLTIRKKEDNIFEFINCLVKRDYDNLFRLYEDLLSIEEEQTKLIVMIYNQLKLIYKIKTLLSYGKSNAEIAISCGIREERVFMVNKTSLSLEKTLIKPILNKLSELDIDIKKGNIDKNIGFEVFLLGL